MELQTMPLLEEMRWRKIRIGLVIFALLLPILLSVVLQVQVKPSDYSGARAALEAGFQGDGFFWAAQGVGDATMYLADIGEVLPLMHLYDLAYLAGGVLFLFLCIEKKGGRNVIWPSIPYWLFSLLSLVRLSTELDPSTGQAPLYNRISLLGFDVMFMKGWGSLVLYALLALGCVIFFVREWKQMKTLKLRLVHPAS
ncbi:MAG: hypothetical protein PHY23_03430 [Oscillospiraceae bacterium]|jgi:hypothetical protein|nr:hypothetical protein [Oscillospiraceae bacterium]